MSILNICHLAGDVLASLGSGIGHDRQRHLILVIPENVSLVMKIIHLE